MNPYTNWTAPRNRKNCTNGLNYSIFQTKNAVLDQITNFSLKLGLWDLCDLEEVLSMLTKGKGWLSSASQSPLPAENDGLRFFSILAPRFNIKVNGISRASSTLSKSPEKHNWNNEGAEQEPCEGNLKKAGFQTRALSVFKISTRMDKLILKDSLKVSTAADTEETFGQAVDNSHVHTVSWESHK